MDTSDPDPPSFWRSPGGVALLIAAAVGGFFLYTEHRAHLFGMLPFLLLLACPVMHLFMHHGHRHDGHSHARGHGGSNDEQRR